MYDFKNGQEDGLIFRVFDPKIHQAHIILKHYFIFYSLFHILVCYDRNYKPIYSKFGMQLPKLMYILKI